MITREIKQRSKTYHDDVQDIQYIQTLLLSIRNNKANSDYEQNIIALGSILEYESFKGYIDCLNDSLEAYIQANTQDDIKLFNEIIRRFNELDELKNINPISNFKIKYDIGSILLNIMRRHNF